MSARAEALFAVAERGIADELVLRAALVGMPDGDERRALLDACRVIERAYERANEAAMYLRGLERGYDLRKGIALEEDDPRRRPLVRRPSAPSAATPRRDRDDIEPDLWGPGEPLL